MAASMSVANSVKGKCQKMLLTVRFIPGCHQPRLASTDTEAEAVDFDFDEEEFEKKLAKIRDCSRLNKTQKLKHYGEVPDEILSDSYRGNRRNKLRKLYAEHGAASGINPGIMFPSRAELADLWDVEKNWTQSFEQMKSTLKEQKAAQELAVRQRDEKIEKAMKNMNQLIKQHLEKESKAEEDKQRKDTTEELLDEFKEKYGFNVKPDSLSFKAFKRQRSEEIKLEKAKQRKKEKKEAGIKNLKAILGKKVKQ